MFPNGSNAKGGHYYYDEWAASGHSYRGALTSTLLTPWPSRRPATVTTVGHDAQSRFDQGCYKCHTGEGYMKSKNTTITKYFTPTPDNVGLMGQECTVCHSGHPSAVGASDVVRAPDNAGERSAYRPPEGQRQHLRGLPQLAVRSDGHQARLRADGRPLGTRVAEPSRSARRSRLRSMVEVAKADGAFMPGAKCEDCHMPKTNKTANRISHGMKPMLPGDAEKWNTAAGSAYQGRGFLHRLPRRRDA